MSMRIYFATDIHGSDVCWRKFLNAAKFYDVDTLILGGDVSGKAVVPVVAHPAAASWSASSPATGCSPPRRPTQAETRIRDMGFYPYRTTDEELDATWDQPDAVNRVFLTLMRQTLTRWLDLAEQRLAGPASGCTR